MATRIRQPLIVHMVQGTAGANTEAYTATMSFRVMDILLHTRVVDGNNNGTTDFNRSGVALCAQLTSVRTANAQGRCTTIVNAEAEFAVGDILNMVNAAGDGLQVTEAYVWVAPNGSNNATAS